MLEQMSDRPVRYHERRHEATRLMTWMVNSNCPRRVLPDANMDLIWDRKVLMFAGPDVSAFTVQGGSTVGLRLPPGIGPLVIGIDAHELVGQRVDLVDLVPVWLCRRARGKVERDPCAALIRLLCELLDYRRASLADTARAALLHGAVRSRLSIAAASAQVGLSSRQAHRISRTWFGYGLKTLQSILRFHDAVTRIRVGQDLSLAAAAAGYADQAHLTREVKRFSGVSPRQLQRQP